MLFITVILVRQYNIIMKLSIEDSRILLKLCLFGWQVSVTMLTFQEKFKREFRIKLRHFRRFRGKSNANHGRFASMRSTTLSEWKRGYSTRCTDRTTANGLCADSPPPRRDELEMFVCKSGKITLIKCGSRSDLEELCL